MFRPAVLCTAFLSKRKGEKEERVLKRFVIAFASSCRLLHTIPEQGEGERGRKRVKKASVNLHIVL